LVIVTVVALTACGGGGGKESETGTTTSSSTAVPSTTSTTLDVVEPLQLTEAGLGALAIGMSTSAASDTGLIGALGPGCELAGPGQQAAPLQGGVTGLATFDGGTLSAISVRGGVSTAAGIHVDSSLADVQAAYGSDGYVVSVDDSTIEMFGIAIVTITKNGQPAFGMTLDPVTQTVTGMATPNIQFCE
jgi:hypothetical protein